MQTSIAGTLNALNRAFYSKFAAEFAATRIDLWPGMRRSMEWIGDCEHLVDVGCGSGRVLRALASGSLGARVGRYTGIDASVDLMGHVPLGSAVDSRLVEADLTQPGWSERAAVAPESCDALLCFATLFHVPQAATRLRVLQEAAGLVRPAGVAAISVWRLLGSERMQAKVVPWERVGLSAADVETGDLLVDWRRGGAGVRYVHHFEDGELEDLCEQAGFVVEDSFASDGVEGDLNRVVWLRK